MPYRLSKNQKCIVKADSGEVVKCHPTVEKAKAHLAALEMNVEDAKSMTKKNTSTKQGARHSKPDHEHGAAALDNINQAADHLKQAGFDNAAPAKALAMFKAAKAVPAGFDPGQYAQGEAWDAATAAQIIPQLVSLLSSEMYQQDPEGVGAIQQCIEGLSRFIAAEVADMAEGLAADAAEDVNAPDEPGAMMSAYRSAAIDKHGDPLQLVSDGLVSFGETVKAIKSEGGLLTVGSYGVRFGTKAQRDLDEQWFGKDTDFGPNAGDGVAALFHHGQPLKGVLQNLTLKTFKHPVKVVRDDIGLFVKHVLEISDEYEKAVADLIQDGKAKLRWSSGAALHAVVLDEKSGQIKMWLPAEFSYTPSAAEYRLPPIMPLKAYLKSIGDAEAAARTGQRLDSRLLDLGRELELLELSI